MRPPSTSSAALICRGDVVHKRLRPTRHAMRYRVFSLLIDVDRIDEAVRDCVWFSHDRFNLLSLRTRDFGDGRADDLAADARRMFTQAGHVTDGCRVLLLAYPRVLGFAFNPLSVFLLLDADERLRAVIYEVSNTFGERTRYVVNAGASHDGVYAQSTDKTLYVSPFTPRRGQYSFRIAIDDQRVLVAVLLRDDKGALLKTRFVGFSRPLTSAAAAAVVAAYPLLALKVVVGIHWEALKLWCKGVPLVQRHISPRYSEQVCDPASTAMKAPHV